MTPETRGRPVVAPTKSIPDEVQTLIGYFDIIACADYRKLFSLIGETVCLPDVFSLTRKYFCFWFAVGDTFHSALICASYCLTFAPETREKGWRNRVHTNVGALCAVERANAVKAPSSLKAKATDTAFRFPLKSQYRLPILFILGALPRQTF